MKMAAIEVDESYEFPKGVLHLGENGWAVDSPLRMKIGLVVPIPDFFAFMSDRFAGMLGEGELVMAIYGIKEIPDQSMKTTEYDCRIMFLPDE